MTTWPRVAIVGLNWNGCRDTLEWLESVRRLAYQNAIVVVVDNGSSDDSVARLRETDAHLTILETGRNLGFAAGNNVAIRFCLAQRVDYVWLLNNDTVVERHALTALVQTAEATPTLGLVGSVIYDYRDPGRIQTWGGGMINRWAGTVRPCRERDLTRIDYVSGTSLLIRTSVLKEVGLLNEGLFFYWEDVDLAVRARRAGWACGVARASYVYHKGSHTVGAGSPTADLLETQSLTVFLFTHLGVLGAVPLTVRLAGKVLKRVVRRQPAHLWAICRGAANGLRTVFTCTAKRSARPDGARQMRSPEADGTSSVTAQDPESKQRPREGHDQDHRA
jgi:GT2 family glycosyltransferase